MNLEDLTKDFDPTEVMDEIEIENIDISAIDNESTDVAEKMVENLSNFYYDETFMKENPNFKKRVDSEMESLRGLIKMRKSDEVIHDILIKSIAKNPGNASLYRALSEIQKTSLSITTKMEGVISNLNVLMEKYQQMLDAAEETSNEEPSEKIEKTSVFRGTKKFIVEMQKQKEEAV